MADAEIRIDLKAELNRSQTSRVTQQMAQDFERAGRKAGQDFQQELEQQMRRIDASTPAGNAANTFGSAGTTAGRRFADNVDTVINRQMAVVGRRAGGNLADATTTAIKSGDWDGAGRHAGREFERAFERSAKPRVDVDSSSSAKASGDTAGDAFAGGFAGASALKSLGTKGGPIAAAIAGGTLAGIKLVGPQIRQAMEVEFAGSLAQARIGVDDAAFANTALAAGQAWAANFGDSIAANLDTAVAGIQSGLIKATDPVNIQQKTIEQLTTVSTILAEDIAEVSRAASQAIKTGIATDATSAFDLLVAAQQQGLNTSGDLLDTITEYGTQFRKLGLEGPEAFGLLAQAVRNGARDTDVAADALKEFSIRVVDGSETTAEAFEALGLDADQMAERFAAGGRTSADAFDEVVDKIRDIKDPVEQSRIQVQLFGTQAEDLGDAIKHFDLSTAVDQFGEVEGASQRAGDKMVENSLTEWQQAGRNIEVVIQRIRDKLNVDQWFSTPLKAFNDLFEPDPTLTPGEPGVPAVPTITNAPGSATPPVGPPVRQNPLDIFAPGRAMGGPSPTFGVRGPTGGFLTEMHPNEWVLPEHVRRAIGDPALWALTAGNVPLAVAGSGQRGTGDWNPDGTPINRPGGGGWHTGTHGWFGGPDVDMWIPGGHSMPTPRWTKDRGRTKMWGLPGFAGGGFIDEFGNPITPGTAPGPVQPIAPNPSGGGIDSIVSGFMQGAQGPLQFGTQILNNVLGTNIQAGQDGGGGGDKPLTPGFWGLAEAGNDPKKLEQWGAQTGKWLSDWGVNTLGSAAKIAIGAPFQFLDMGNPLEGPYGQAAVAAIDHFANLAQPAGAPPPSSEKDIDAAIAAQTSHAGGPSAVNTETTSGGPSVGSAAGRAIAFAQANAVGQEYLYGGTTPAGYDCSGIASAIYAAAKGLPQTRYFTTESDFQKLGFLPGYMPGALNVGIKRGGGGRNSHMALTLPNGVNVESGGSHGTTAYGDPAKGAGDFPLQYFLPLDKGDGEGSVPGVYDAGGFLPPGLSLAVNRTGKPEPVLTADQGKAVQALAKQAAVPPPPRPSYPRGPDAQMLIPPGDGQIQPNPEDMLPGTARPALPGTPIGPAPPPPSLAPPPPQFAPVPGGERPPVGPVAASAGGAGGAGGGGGINYTLPWVNKAIESGAAVAGNIGAAAAGAFGGGAFGGLIQGLAGQGGKIMQGIANIVSASLVGSVPGSLGTQDSLYGKTLRPQQNIPQTAEIQRGAVTSYGPFYGHDTTSVMQEINLHEAVHQQSAFASHYGGRV